MLLSRTASLRLLLADNRGMGEVGGEMVDRGLLTDGSEPLNSYRFENKSQLKSLEPKAVEE